jgi:hypothetical protein
MDLHSFFRKGMETMRLLNTVLLTLGLLGLTFGCDHMHGVCDCDPHGMVAAPIIAPGHPPVLKPEPIKMPTEAPKSTASTADVKPVETGANQNADGNP